MAAAAALAVASGSLLAIGGGPTAAEQVQAVAGLGIGAACGGHRVLVITRKDGKVVIIPLAPRTARAVGPAAGERCESGVPAPGWPAP